MAGLRPFREIPKTLVEWTRWMSEQDVGGESTNTFEDITVTGEADIEEIDAGFISLKDEGWEDLTADLASGKTAGSNVPTWSAFRGGLSAYSFSATSMKELWITFHITHQYKDGTKIYPHIHWSPGNSVATGTVRWGIEYSFAKGHNQDAFGATTIMYLEETIDTGVAYQHYITEASDEQAFSEDLETDGLLLCRIFRDAAHANDDFGSAVFGLTADIHFEVGQVATPNKAPPFINAP